MVIAAMYYDVECRYFQCFKNMVDCVSDQVDEQFENHFFIFSNHAYVNCATHEYYFINTLYTLDLG